MTTQLSTSPVAYLPPPGHPLGCCGPYPCPHLRCRQQRGTASSTCRLCGLTIGYERRYTVDPNGICRYVHASCLARAERMAATSEGQP